MSAPSFVLDANVFLHAHRDHYPFDVVPGFWLELLKFGERGQVCTIDRILGELKRQGDALEHWATDKFRPHVRVSSDPATMAEYRRIVAWANAHPQYRDSAKSAFMSGEDAWLVAFAAAHGQTVVTHEVSAPASQKAIKLPEVCAYAGVPHANTVGMLRLLGARIG